MSEIMDKSKLKREMRQLEAADAALDLANGRDRLNLSREQIIEYCEKYLATLLSNNL